MINSMPSLSYLSKAGRNRTLAMTKSIPLYRSKPLTEILQFVKRHNILRLSKQTSPTIEAVCAYEERISNRAPPDENRAT